MGRRVSILAFVAVATSLALGTRLRDPPYPLTAAVELVGSSIATSNPIRTVVTVNSNQIDVLAADEKDVPKVLEKLRELCAGPFASLYPEICEHIVAGEDVDLDGLDRIVWWPSEEATSQIVTATSKRDDVPSSEVPTPRTSSASLPSETGWTERPSSISIVASEPTPAESSTPLLVTLTVPAEIMTTKTFEVVVHELSKTGLSLSPSNRFEESSVTATLQVPTTLETKIKSNASEAASITNSNSEAGKTTAATDTIYDPGRTITADTKVDLVSTTAEAGTSIELATTTASTETRDKFPETVSATSTGDGQVQITPIAITTDQPETAISTAYDTQREPETSIECPYKAGDDLDDDAPGPCTVITIWHKTVIPDTTSTILSVPTNSEFRPIFTPTASPRPNRSRNSFTITLPESPPSTTHAPSLWVAPQFSGCTQTVRLLKKMGDAFTATVYPGTVTSTVFISCSCPNLATEFIGDHGLVLRPRTTVTETTPATTKTFSCSPSVTCV